MSLENFLSGLPDTSLEPRGVVICRRIILVIFFSTLGLALLAIWFSNFVPTPITASVGLYCAAVWATIGAAGGMLPVKPGAKVKEWAKPRAIRIPLFGLLFFCFGYIAFTDGFPALYTRLFGATGERLVHVSYWSGGRKTCYGVQVSEAIFVSHICLSRDLQKRLPPGKAFTISGPQTPFGTYVENVRWQE